MNRRGLRLVGLFAMIVAVLAGIYAVSQRLGSIEQLTVANPAAAVGQLFASRLDDAGGRPQPFSQWQGKTLVVNFWATWCPPCREEMPAFSRLQVRYAAKGVQFVGIALDSAESVEAFAERQAISYPLLIGGSQAVDLAQQFGNTTLSLPYTVLISPAKELSLVRLGPLSEAELERFLARATSR